jgi:NAD(P)H dehydrogenase (quinone)
MRHALAWILSLCLLQSAVAQEKLIVSGASGQLGSLVVEELLARGVAPENLILVSRTPDTLAKYAALGANVRYGDFTEPESLPAAYAGGTRMLLISIGGGAPDRAQRQAAAIDAAVAAGVEHIAYTSYMNADRHTQSILAPDHQRTEAHLRASGIAWTFLRNGIYANGLVDQAREALRTGEIVTHTPDARVAYVTREDCAAAAAAVLATPGHENRAYNVTGPDAVGPRELAALAAEIGGRPVELVVLDEAAYVARLRAAGSSEQGIRGALSFAAELASPLLREPSSAVADLTGRAPTSVRDLLAAHRDELRDDTP